MKKREKNEILIVFRVELVPERNGGETLVAENGSEGPDRLGISDTLGGQGRVSIDDSDFIGNARQGGGGSSVPVSIRKQKLPVRAVGGASRTSGRHQIEPWGASGVEGNSDDSSHVSVADGGGSESGSLPHHTGVTVRDVEGCVCEPSSDRLLVAGVDRSERRFGITEIDRGGVPNGG